MVEKKLWDWPTNNWSKLKPWHCLDDQEAEAWKPRNSGKGHKDACKNISVKLLVKIFCYTSRYLHSLIVIRAASASNEWLRTDAEKYSQTWKHRATPQKWESMVCRNQRCQKRHLIIEHTNNQAGLIEDWETEVIILDCVWVWARVPTYKL